MEYYSSIWMPTDSLAHHGIKGMKWGVRRYQNADGTLTSAGRKRYYGASDKIQKDIDSFKGLEKGVYDKKGRTLLSETDVRNSVKGLEIARDKAKQKGDARRNKDFQKLKRKEERKNRYAKSVQMKEQYNEIKNKKHEEIKSNSNDYKKLRKENLDLEKRFGPDVFEDYDDEELFELVKDRAKSRTGVSDRVLDNAISRHRVNSDSMKIIDDDAYEKAKEYANGELISRYGDTAIKDMNYSDNRDLGIVAAGSVLMLGGMYALSKLADG